MSASSKSAALQAQFLYDDDNSYFNVIHNRGQRVTKHDRILNPITAAADNVGGKRVEFRISKVGHMANYLVLHFDYVVNNAVLAATGTDANTKAHLWLVDFPAYRAIQQVEIDYAGDNIVRVSSDEIRVNCHLYMTDAEKEAEWRAATGTDGFLIDNVAKPEEYRRYRKLHFAAGDGVLNKTIHPSLSNNTSENFDHGVEAGKDIEEPAGFVGATDQQRLKVNVQHLLRGTVSQTGKTRVHWSVEIPWTHQLSSDRNAPVALMDDEPIVRVQFNEAFRLVGDVVAGLGGVPLTATIVEDPSTVTGLHYLEKPYIQLEYRDQPGEHLNMLAAQPTITYPLSQVITERHSVAINQTPGQTETYRLTGLRGLMHTMAFLIREARDLEGGRLQDGIKLFDYDSYDFTDKSATALSGYDLARQLGTWTLSANGERIAGKIQRRGDWDLTTYKRKYFPMHTELDAPTRTPASSGYYPSFDGLSAAADPFAGGQTRTVSYFRGSQMGVLKCGKNIYAYTWGMDGDRSEVGTGTINVDNLSSIELSITQRGAADHGYPGGNSQAQYLDVMEVSANFDTVAGGNWFRQLS